VPLLWHPPARTLATVRRELENLLRDATLFSLGAAIALAWMLVQLASAIDYAIGGFIEKNPQPEVVDLFGEHLVVRAGDHVLTLAPVLNQTIAFAIVLAVVLLAARRRGASAGTRT
jgi:hypothetical protein